MPESRTPANPESRFPANPESRFPANPESRFLANPESRFPTNPESRFPTNPESRFPNPALYACIHRPPAPGQYAAGADGPASNVAAIAAQFSPRYQCHGADLVSIDVSGLERLLGPAQTIGEELRRESAARGMRAHVAVAGTRMTALVLAIVRPGLVVVASGGEAEALAPVHIGVLEKVVDDGSAGSAVSAFRRWGIKTLGELAALPPADLAARMGKGALAWRAIARGEDTRPLVPTLAEERFESTIDLEWPIEGLEPLSFVLTRLLEPLSTRLERRDRGAAVLHVLLRLVTRASTAAEPCGREVYARRLELPTPMRDVRTLRTLALLDLETHPPGAGIDRVTIVIDPTPGRVLQHTLFTRARPTPEQLSTLVARLGALMGQDRFGAPATVDSYRPGAFAMAPFATDHDDQRRTRGARGENVAHDDESRTPNPESRTPNPESRVVSALRRCRQPVPARVVAVDDRPVRVTTDRCGFAGGTVVGCAGPWRTSGQWWSGGSGESAASGASGEDVSACSTSPTYQAHPAHPARQAYQAGQAYQAHPAYQARQAYQAHPARQACPAPQGRPAHEAAWNRDEWDVSLSDGAMYRVFRDRETGAWFIDAIVD